MPKLRNIIVLLLLAVGFWHFYGNALATSGLQGLIGEIQKDIQSVKENPQVQSTLEKIKTEFDLLLDKVAQSPGEAPIQNPVEPPQLNQPANEVFSVHNVEIGQARSQVEKQAGQPKRTSRNEYGVDWVAYHENYHNFFMVAYDDQDKVAGLYTDQDLLTSSMGISYGTPREQVLEGGYERLESIRKGFVSYRLESNGEYDLFLIDDQYVTVFYDRVKGDGVTAILLVEEELERKKKAIYGEPSAKLKEGYEFQLFDLTNAARVKNGLAPLAWDDAVKLTARKHSLDMAENEYFNHTNLEGLSPFERMEEDGISFRMAGENIAMGQFSSIFAHEGLMNSPGHRENILQTDFRALGVGVAFSSEGQPYFTENFLTK